MRLTNWADKAKSSCQNGLEAATIIRRSQQRVPILGHGNYGVFQGGSFDDAIRTWEQIIGVKSIEQAIQIRSVCLCQEGLREAHGGDV